MKTRRIAALVLLLSATARAGTTEFVPVQQRAQGQSLTGASLLNDSLFANPASSAFTNVYSVDTTYLSTRTFAVSVLDTRTSGVGGGLAYYRVARPGIDQPLQAGKLGLMGRLAEGLGVGITGKAVWGPDLAGTSGTYKDIDVGILGKISFVQLGLNINNIFGGSEPMGERREYSLGTRLNWEDTLYFSAAVSGELDSFRPVQFGFGAEYLSPYSFALKGGFRTRPVDQRSFWGAGFSVLSQRVSLHYGVEFENRAGGYVEHSIGTTVLF